MPAGSRRRLHPQPALRIELRALGVPASCVGGRGVPVLRRDPRARRLGRRLRIGQSGPALRRRPLRRPGHQTGGGLRHLLQQPETAAGALERSTSSIGPAGPRSGATISSTIRHRNSARSTGSTSTAAIRAQRFSLRRLQHKSRRHKEIASPVVRVPPSRTAERPPRTPPSRTAERPPRTPPGPTA